MRFVGLKSWSMIMTFVIASVLMCFVSSCAKEVTETTLEVQKRIYGSYIRANGYQDAEMIGDDIYVLERGGAPSGVSPKDSTYAYVQYSARSISGGYLAHNYEHLAKQLGTYKTTNFYGDYVWPISMNFISDPLSKVLKTMKPGEKSLCIVPPWLNTSNAVTAYSSTTDPVIYEIELKTVVDDVLEHQRELLKEFSYKYFGGIDSLALGFYCDKIYDSGYKDTITDNASIKVWYVGRFLSGKVFDTNIEDTAKMYDLHVANKTYSPLTITYQKDLEKFKEESDLVAGFCKAILSNDITYGDKCYTFFDSDWGYGRSGSLSGGKGIPPFYPISFEIWLESND